MPTYDHIARKFDTNGKRVDHIDVILTVKNVTGTIYFTDIMLQGGTLATLWYGHPSEVEWSFNA